MWKDVGGCELVRSRYVSKECKDRGVCKTIANVCACVRVCLYVCVTAVMPEAIKHIDLLHNLLFINPTHWGGTHTSALSALCQRHTHMKRYQNDWHRHRNSNPFTHTHPQHLHSLHVSGKRLKRLQCVWIQIECRDELEKTKRGMKARRGEGWHSRRGDNRGGGHKKLKWAIQIFRFHPNPSNRTGLFMSWWGGMKTGWKEGWRETGGGVVGRWVGQGEWVTDTRKLRGKPISGENALNITADWRREGRQRDIRNKKMRGERRKWNDGHSPISVGSPQASTIPALWSHPGERRSEILELPPLNTNGAAIISSHTLAHIYSHTHQHCGGKGTNKQSQVWGSCLN